MIRTGQRPRGHYPVKIESCVQPVLSACDYFEPDFAGASGQVPFALRGPVPSRSPLPQPRPAPLPWTPQAGQFVRGPPFGQMPPVA